jgi:predicted dithiol-disulfide oxidoreductase (DUF899 family)
MTRHVTASKDEWLEARKQLLAREKEFTRLRDQLSADRRALPWLRIDQTYRFEGRKGSETLAELFEGRSQLVVYHFMFAPEWEQGCKSCSFWADNFNGVVAHLEQRDITMIAVSRAPLAKLQAYAGRLGWSFKWVSSADSDFSYDFQVSFMPGEQESGRAIYNYGPLAHAMSDMPGISVFTKDAEGAVFHTYSCYARGLDMLNTAYHYMDLVPKGRDESSGIMRWLKRRDEYGT